MSDLFNEAAYNYITLDETLLNLLSLLLLVLGAIVAVYSRFKAKPLGRSAFIFFTSLIFLLGSASQYMWFTMPQATKSGVLWLLMLLQTGTSIVIGYLFMRIAMKRSFDARGDTRMAPLAFIPFANLWLVFASPLVKRTSKRKLLSAIGNTFLIVFALIGMGITAALNVAAKSEFASMTVALQSDMTFQVANLELSLRAKGLADTMKLMASEDREKLDEITTLFKTSVSGTTLEYWYEISSQQEDLSFSFGADVTKNACADVTTRMLIKAGAIVRYSYQRVDGTPLGVITVTENLCKL